MQLHGYTIHTEALLIPPYTQGNLLDRPQLLNAVHSSAGRTAVDARTKHGGMRSHCGGYNLLGDGAVNLATLLTSPKQPRRQLATACVCLRLPYAFEGNSGKGKAK
eukprot:scaffold31727_cov135-Isochrysis_galbana.AAC.1